MKIQRIEMLDLARGIALVAMTIFHFAFDLQLLGFKEPGYIDQPHWKYFARSIASSFLILTGFSLYLAHHDGIRWRGWRWRFAKIISAALLITVATYFATPEQYIFFGILHAIAFASLFGLLFLKSPVTLTLLLAAGIFWLGNHGRTDLLESPLWFWTGLTEARPISSDYVPVFPWMAAALLGVALAKYLLETGHLEKLARPEFEHFPGRVLKFIGRNSLVYYLLHQPVMLGLIIAVSWTMGWISFN